MKTGISVIVAAILVLAGITGMAAFNTLVGRQEEQIANQQAEIDRLEAWRYWMQIAALPPPYHQPLDQLWISSGAGFRTDPLGGIDAEEKLHRGTDLAGDIGDPVYAMLAGIVVEHWVPPDGGRWKGHSIYGGYIVVDHGGELLTEYAHLSASFVHEGDWVETGEKIGLVGESGMCTGPHAHVAVVVSPLRYFAERR